MKAHVIFDIDELVSFGTLKLSTETLNSLTADLDKHDSGHHVGEVALIHSTRLNTNERLASEDAEKRYFQEFGRTNSNALAYYRGKGEYSDFGPLKPVPAPEGLLNRKTGDLSERIGRHGRAVAGLASTEQPYPTDPVPAPEGLLNREQAQGQQLYLQDNPPETPTEEWLRKEKDAKEHPDPVR